MSEATATATMKTELTVKRSQFPFLFAAFRHAGWDVDEEFEGVTTDEGYDHEVKMTLKITVPLEALADAPEVGDLEMGGWDRLIADMALVA